MTSTRQVVQNYLNIFFGEKFNPEILKSILTDNFNFNGPLMAATSLQEFILKLKAFGEEIEMNAEIHQLICQENTAVARYDFLLPNGNRVSACEWYEIEDDKIARILLFCDPKPFLDI